jgi:predicted kinase
MAPPNIVVVMGISGSGKSTVGRQLAERLGWPFHDGDDFHPAQNVSKMSKGIPLDDDDRRPWLQTLHDALADILKQGGHAVLAASLLKQVFAWCTCAPSRASSTNACRSAKATSSKPACLRLSSKSWKNRRTRWL